MRTHGAKEMAFLKYGFQFRRGDVVENIVHNPLEEVVGNIKSAVNRSDEALSAIIQGVDDAWEVCLLKFTVDLIEQSSRGNLGDFRRHGLL